MCLDDVCLNKDDILKLKQMKVSGGNNSVSATAAANKSNALAAAKKEAVDKAIEMKGAIDIKVTQLEDVKLSLDKSVVDALKSQTNAIALVESARIQKEAANKEVEVANTEVQKATTALNIANESGDIDGIKSAEVAKSSVEFSLSSYQESQSNAQIALDTAVSEKNAADKNVLSVTSRQIESATNLTKAMIEQTKAAEAITILSK
jgi:hypothetical protein